MTTMPPTSVRPGMAPAPRDAVTPAMLEALRKTKPWVRFLSILGFLGSAVMVLVGIGLAIFGMVAGGGSDNPMGPVAMAGIGLLYVLLALLYIIPSRYLFRYASAIKRALDSPSKTQPIEEALGYQKSFWKFCGILMLIMILLYIPLVIAAVAIPNFMSAMQRAKEKSGTLKLPAPTTLSASYDPAPRGLR
jgi:uncharacterized protein DUF5362